MVRLARSLVPVVLGCAVALAAPAEADAKCASPGVALSPGANGRLGAVAPHNPTVYVFVPGLQAEEPPAITATVGGDAIPVEVEKLSTAPAFATYRVRLETGLARHATVEVEGRYGRVLTSRYRLVPSWKRGKPPALRATRRVQDRWRCSHTNVWELTMTRSRAVAYRVEYASSRRALEDDPKVTVFPADMSSAFWGSNRHGAPVIELGHPNCFGYTIDQAAMRGRIVGRFAALYPDGTVGPFSEVFELGKELPEPPADPPPPEPPEPPAPPVATPVEPPAPPPAPAPQPTEASAWWPVWLAALGGGALVVALLLGYAIRRRLVPPHN